MIKEDGIPMEWFILFIIVPLIGVLWFLNLIAILKNIIEGKSGKNTPNYTLLGAALTYLFICGLIFEIIFFFE